MTVNRTSAWQLLSEWTQSDSLRKHALAVEAAVRGYARLQGANEEEWGVVALLHDFDYERYPTLDLLRTYGPDWKVIFVGDAAMNPYELIAIDGSAEYRNLEPGIVWLQRIFGHFRRVVWWNPEPPRTWEYTRTTQLILQALGPRMFPLTLAGIADGIDALRH